MNKLYEYIWKALPDKCQCIGCQRKGVRGNENRVGGKIVCDDCYLREGHLYFDQRAGIFARRALMLMSAFSLAAATGALFGAILNSIRNSLQ